MQKPTPKISFITVNYNGVHHTANLLHTIFAYITTVEFEVVVIDNGSKVNEFDQLRVQFPAIKGGYQLSNLGFAEGNNKGIAQALGDYLYFINNDTLLPKEVDSQLQAMIAYCESDEYIGGLSPKILYADPKNVIQFAGSTELTAITLRNKQIGYFEYDTGQYEQIRQIPYFHGAAMFVPAKVVRHVGGLPDCYFMYYEELDWSCQMRKEYALYYFPKASVYHLESATTGQESPFKVYYLTRNRFIFACRNRKHIWRILALSYLTLVAFPAILVRYIIKQKPKQCWAVVSGAISALGWMVRLKNKRL